MAKWYHIQWMKAENYAYNTGQLNKGAFNYTIMEISWAFDDLLLWDLKKLSLAVFQFIHYIIAYKESSSYKVKRKQSIVRYAFLFKHWNILWISVRHKLLTHIIRRTSLALSNMDKLGPSANIYVKDQPFILAFVGQPHI